MGLGIILKNAIRRQIRFSEAYNEMQNTKNWLKANPEHTQFSA